MVKTIFAALISATLLASCSLETGTLSTPEYASESRSSSQMEVSIQTTGNNEVNLTPEKVVVSSPTSASFTVTVDPGLLTEQTYYAVSLTTTHAEDGLKITKNPGFYQVVYEDKGEVTVSPNSTSVFDLLINPGSINTTSYSTIIEEDDSI